METKVKYYKALVDIDFYPANFRIPKGALVKEEPLKMDYWTEVNGKSCKLLRYNNRLCYLVEKEIDLLKEISPMIIYHKEN